MRISRRQLRILVESRLSGASCDEKYRCFDGRVVKFGSKESLKDIDKRIQDAIQTRDTCRSRTDKRVAYNSLLQMLRREKRAAQKEYDRVHGPKKK